MNTEFIKHRVLKVVVHYFQELVKLPIVHIMSMLPMH
jgi:hypothetical protein